MSKHDIDATRKLEIPGDKEETLTFCIRHFIHAAKMAIQDHGYFYVALSGGSTPKALFQKLASDEYKTQLDYSKVMIFWGDERSVPPTDAESNYKMAMDNGLKALNIPEDNIHRMVAEENIQENAKLYANEVTVILNDKPFDYIMLGMGDDGHTASLFPATDALNEEREHVMANFVPQKKTWRMTFTYPLINQARNIVIYVLGQKKAPMIKRVLTEKTRTKHSPQLT